jgi:hypothetical protein
MIAPSKIVPSMIVPAKKAIFENMRQRLSISFNL